MLDQGRATPGLAGVARRAARPNRLRSRCRCEGVGGIAFPCCVIQSQGSAHDAQGKSSAKRSTSRRTSWRELLRSGRRGGQPLTLFTPHQTTEKLTKPCTDERHLDRTQIRAIQTRSREGEVKGSSPVADGAGDPSRNRASSVVIRWIEDLCPVLGPADRGAGSVKLVVRRGGATYL